jgi:hypothetical protein
VRKFIIGINDSSPDNIAKFFKVIPNISSLNITGGRFKPLPEETVLSINGLSYLEELEIDYFSHILDILHVVNLRKIYVPQVELN